MDELKPCPLCGRQPLCSRHNDRDYCQFFCRQTDHQVSGTWGVETEAVRTWNHRPLEDASCGKIEQLLNIADGLDDLLDYAMDVIKIEIAFGSKENLLEHYTRINKDWAGVLARLDGVGR